MKCTTSLSPAASSLPSAAAASFVLVTGDPPANPQFLSQALGNVGGPDYAVIDIPWGPALRGEDVERAVPRLAGARASGGAAAQPECSAPASPLFIFDDIDQLSDQQIKEAYESTLHADQIRAAGVLLAPPADGGGNSVARRFTCRG